MASPLEKKFKRAVWLVRHGPPDPTSTNDEKLQFYAFYKQALEGDVKGSQPWAVQFEARAKWDAWAEKKGMSKEEAMQAYIDLVAAGDTFALSYDIFAKLCHLVHYSVKPPCAGDSAWESHAALKDYKEDA